MVDFNDFYANSTATATPQGAAMPSASVNGSFSQSASLAATAEGAPAVWFLLLVGVSLFLMHYGNE